MVGRAHDGGGGCVGGVKRKGRREPVAGGANGREPPRERGRCAAIRPFVERAYARSLTNQQSAAGLGIEGGSVTFDLVNYEKLVGRVAIDDLDFDSFRHTPLRPEVLRCLRYMHVVEHHTVCYLRDLLVTSVHKDPRSRLSHVLELRGVWPGDANVRAR